jgi:hypothetical protein
MEPTNNDLKRSGAVRATCLAYHKYSALYPLWENMRQWAEREFRQYSPSTLDRLILLAQSACDDAYNKRFGTVIDPKEREIQSTSEGV